MGTVVVLNRLFLQHMVAVQTTPFGKCQAKVTFIVGVNEQELFGSRNYSHFKFIDKQSAMDSTTCELE